ncbi:E3 ubiquitin-protein ligase RNF25, partial [Brachionichthys hirsutus]|uniref:E3 ubiquitin-protein ligase RNF25 n=1 Tax=Brachionichthys hirsutus TaxID=412623 RepID=UPI0036049FB9
VRSVLSELEVLQSIYLDELQVNSRDDGSWGVSLVLYPSTAEDSLSQFVRLTLTMTLDQQYPSSAPAISIHNPRGLSDDKLRSVQKCLQLEAQARLGSPALYQLIEKAKEILTDSNVPHGNCVICLHGFQEDEVFTKTSCYHYFHCHCLGRYVSHSESELRQRERELEEDKTRAGAAPQELTVVCPVCREPLTYDVDQLLSSPAPQLPELDEAAIASGFRLKWLKLQKVMERQRSKGGVIDPDEESKRFLIHINQTPSAAENGNPDVDAAPPPSSPHPPAGGTGVGPSRCRGGQSQRHQNPGLGQRRGGRSRAQQRAAPVAEHMDKLSLSSEQAEGPTKAKGQGHFGQRPESLACPDRPPRQEAPEPECPEGATGNHGHHGRRRGSHRPLPHHRSTHCHWDRRASRSRGGPGNLYSRGGGHRGRGFQHSVLEREAGREEVL